MSYAQEAAGASTRPHRYEGIESQTNVSIDVDAPRYSWPWPNCETPFAALPLSVQYFPGYARGGHHLFDLHTDCVASTESMCHAIMRGLSTGTARHGWISGESGAE